MDVKLDGSRGHVTDLGSRPQGSSNLHTILSVLTRWHGATQRDQRAETLGSDFKAAIIRRAPIVRGGRGCGWGEYMRQSGATTIKTKTFCRTHLVNKPYGSSFERPTSD